MPEGVVPVAEGGEGHGQDTGGNNGGNNTGGGDVGGGGGFGAGTETSKKNNDLRVEHDPPPRVSICVRYVFPIISLKRPEGPKVGGESASLYGVAIYGCDPPLYVSTIRA